MLKRKIEKELEFWKDNEKQALLISGARQIGKTYSIHNFIESNFKNCIEINFAYRTELIDTFCQFKNAEELIIKLSSIYGSKLIPHETVIFFDEIQLLYVRREELYKQGKLDLTTSDIITAMKYCVLDGKYRFILSGSLLGATLNNILLYPVGYMDAIQMYPLDFEEYLWARGVGELAINHIKDCFEKQVEVDSSINKIFLDYFKEYVLIGGMPEVVSNFMENKNLHLVQTVSKRILNSYSKDITTYIHDEEKKMRVLEIFKAIPSELNSKNKRFVSSRVIDKSYLNHNDLVDEFLWLTNAGVAIPVYNVTEPVIPLQLALERKTLKLFMNDIGLLDAALLSTGIRKKLLNNEKVINFGAPFENVVAQELYAHGYQDSLFYYNSKKHGEVDFIIEKDGEVLPIEIKSGKTNEMNVYNHTALNNLMKLYGLEKAFVFGECNYKDEGNGVIQLPIYMVSFL